MCMNLINVPLQRAPTPSLAKKDLIEVTGAARREDSAHINVIT